VTIKPLKKIPSILTLSYGVGVGCLGLLTSTPYALVKYTRTYSIRTYAPPSLYRLCIVNMYGVRKYYVHSIQIRSAKREASEDPGELFRFSSQTL
jgi:hypothetical protein